MDTTNRILNRGGFAAALICLFVSACGPNGGIDSGMTDAGTPPGDSGPDMPDAYVPPDEDGGMVDAGTPTGCMRQSDCDGLDQCHVITPGELGVCRQLCNFEPDDCASDEACYGINTPEGGTSQVCVPVMTVAECTADFVSMRWPGCGERYDLPDGMSYNDAAMLAECMSTLGPSHSWATTGTSGCFTDLARESGTDQWLMMLDCPGAGDAPYNGLYRLGADGSFYGNCGNRTMSGEQGNCGILTPTASCRTMNGEFFRGGETFPYRTQIYTHE